MKRWLMVLAFIGLSGLSLAAAGPAHAEDMTGCDSPTISALQSCVAHAVDMGYINDSGVAQSLTAKLDAAQLALDQGQTTAAINILQAFIYEVQAQSGIHIDATHAAHMVMHAQMVIQALGG